MRDAQLPVRTEHRWLTSTSAALSAGSAPIDHPVIRALESAGIRGEQLLVVIQELKDANVTVSTGYYIPTSRELMDQYHILGEAYLKGRIDVRWVMCKETHDVLVARYGQANYARSTREPSWRSDTAPSPEVLAYEVRTVMERNLTWTGHDMLFGIPIRIDPVARRPVFEIIPQVERTDG